MHVNYKKGAILDTYNTMLPCMSTIKGSNIRFIQYNAAMHVNYKKGAILDT